MILRLARQVQVRQEKWGLLFYSQNQHRMFFVRSGNWLTPDHFDGTWNFEQLVPKIAEQQNIPIDKVERNLRKLTDNLVNNGMVAYELQ